MHKKKIKIFRVTTTPISLSVLLKNQLKFINEKKEFEVIGISSSDNILKKVRVDEGIRVIPLNMSRNISLLNDLISLIKMILLIRKEKPDIVHSHTPKAGFISMLAAKICKVPNRLHTVAGLPLMEANGIKKNILIFIEWLTYRCSTKVLVNSKGLKNFIKNKIKIENNKLEVLGFGSSNGIDSKYFKINSLIKKKAKIFKNKYNISNNFLFIFVGRVVKDKGINELVQAFTKFNKHYQNSSLLIIGNEEKSLDPIENITRSIIKSNDNIIKIDFTNDIREYLVASDCFIFPSYREGFPNVLLEANAMELPAIATDINGCNEIIENNKNGIIIKPKNTDALYFAMKKVFLNRNFLHKLKNNCRQKIIKKFDQKFFFKHIHELYKNIVVNTDLLKRRFLIVGNLAESMIIFRGELIKDLVKKGYNVVCASPHFSPIQRKIINNFGADCVAFKFSKQSLNPFLFVKDYYQIKKKLNKIKPFNILSYTATPIFYIGFYSFFKKINHIILIAGMGYYFNNYNKKIIVRHILSFLYKISCLNAKLIIFQNKYDQIEFKKFDLVDHKTKKIIVNGSGINIKEFSAKKNTINNKIQIVMVSRLLYQKGIKFYVEAAEIVKRIHPEVTFLHIGGFDNSPNRVNDYDYKKWKNQKNIIFKNEISFDKVKNYLSVSDIFVLPSYYREGVPRSSIEALAMRCAIITTNNLGCNETVINEFNGFKVSLNVDDISFDIAKKIIRLVENKKLLEKFKNNSQILSKKFNVKDVNYQIIKAINNIK
jgi:glycosyltransferase involved in cell wall biosynthesis